MSATSAFAAQLAEDLSPQDVRHVLEVFRADIDRLCGVLRDAAETGDTEMFRRVAHGIAGAAGAVGAEGLEQAARIAMTRHDIPAAEYPGHYRQIRGLADEALGDLDRFVAGLDRSGA